MPAILLTLILAATATAASAQPERPLEWRLDEKIDLTLVDADWPTALAALGRIGRAVAILEGPAPTKRVTLTVMGATARGVLDAVAALFGLAWQQADETILFTSRPGPEEAAVHAFVAEWVKVQQQGMSGRLMEEASPLARRFFDLFPVAQIQQWKPGTDVPFRLFTSEQKALALEVAQRCWLSSTMRRLASARTYLSARAAWYGAGISVGVSPDGKMFCFNTLDTSHREEPLFMREFALDPTGKLAAPEAGSTPSVPAAK